MAPPPRRDGELEGRKWGKEAFTFSSFLPSLRFPLVCAFNVVFFDAPHRTPANGWWVFLAVRTHCSTVATDHTSPRPLCCAHAGVGGVDDLVVVMLMILTGAAPAAAAVVVVVVVSVEVAAKLVLTYGDVEMLVRW